MYSHLAALLVVRGQERTKRVSDGDSEAGKTSGLIGSSPSSSVSRASVATQEKMAWPGLRPVMQGCAAMAGCEKSAGAARPSVEGSSEEGQVRTYACTPVSTVTLERVPWTHGALLYTADGAESRHHLCVGIYCPLRPWIGDTARGLDWVGAGGDGGRADGLAEPYEWPRLDLLLTYIQHVGTLVLQVGEQPSPPCHGPRTARMVLSGLEPPIAVVLCLD